MKLYLKIILWLIPLVFLNQQVKAQLLTVETKIENDSILIGDQIYYRFEVTKPKGLDVTFPALHDTLADGIEIIERKKTDTIFLDEEKQKLIKSYTITAFDSGLFYIPPFEFPFEFNNIRDTIMTNAGYLEVFILPVDLQAGIKDIKEPYKAPITFMEILPFLLGAILLSLIIIFAIKYFSRRKSKETGAVIEKPKEPAHIIAFRELNQLKKKKLWQDEKIKLYYSELTRIIREYIERRFGISAMEETSEEIFTEFKNQKLDKALYFELLRQLLVKADLVKFAKDQPLPDENEGYFNHAYSFVEHSKESLPLSEERNEYEISEKSEEQKKELNE
jgi:hypothetical protein